MKQLKIVNNAKVVLGFTLLCILVLVLHYVTNGYTDKLLFSVYRSPLKDPFTYVRFFGHVLGHSGIEHFMGNIMMFVVIGPMLEEKYGSKNIFAIIVITAFTTGLVNFLLFPHQMLLGASGVVFAFILLASFTSYEKNTIPLSFVLVAVLYIGNELYKAFAVNDNVSNLTHIVGGIIGAFFGYILNKAKDDKDEAQGSVPEAKAE